jgi:hypothetical protein
MILNRKCIVWITLLLTSFFDGSSILAAEPWKGNTVARPVEAVLMSGLSIYGDEAAFGVLTGGAYLLKDRHFVGEIDNRVWAEVLLGPAFFSTTNSTLTGFQYSAHARWDVNYNEVWTAYALAGLSGYQLPNRLGGSFTVHPRVALGVKYQTKSALLLRGEVSAEFIGAGVALNF